VNQERLEHFRRILQSQLQEHTAKASAEQAAALASDDDGVKDSVDMSLLDVSKEIAFRLTERESQIVADIDQALLRIREGSYGICTRCSQPIDERRLEAVPTARFDAACQQLIEQAQGLDDLPSL
jgi:RNA polymerase-binding transcription factor